MAEELSKEIWRFHPAAYLSKSDIPAARIGLFVGSEGTEQQFS
jgi:hypothetical protein